MIRIFVNTISFEFQNQLKSIICSRTLPFLRFYLQVSCILTAPYLYCIQTTWRGASFLPSPIRTYNSIYNWKKIESDFHFIRNMHMNSSSSSISSHLVSERTSFLGNILHSTSRYAIHILIQDMYWSISRSTVSCTQRTITVLDFQGFLKDILEISNRRETIDAEYKVLNVYDWKALQYLKFN